MCHQLVAGDDPSIVVVAVVSCVHGYLQIIKNKQVQVQLGLECHSISNLRLLLSGVHSVGDGDCAVGRTKSIQAKKNRHEKG